MNKQKESVWTGRGGGLSTIATLQRIIPGGRKTSERDREIVFSNSVGKIHPSQPKYRYLQMFLLKSLSVA